ncbi:hypothetical protein CFREI_01135 [Corynebacterium freiburgense]|nr:hypothetical protein CFREI_01135 [Corynebacterium freiburgense]
MKIKNFFGFIIGSLGIICSLIALGMGSIDSDFTILGPTLLFFPSAVLSAFGVLKRKVKT